MVDALAALAPLKLPDSIWRSLDHAYATPPRHYHTLEHILAVARHWATAQWKQPRETFLAVLFHDAVYVAGASDNEERSAELFESLCGADARVSELIRLTEKHGKLEPRDVDAEAAQFLDCDLAILGAAPAAFARYQEQIAREYLPVVGEEAYAFGRRHFLEGLLARSRIFLSDTFHARLDAQARVNLRTALQ